MAPEQRRGEISAAADVYASAVVLFEMLTGRTPGLARGRDRWPAWRGGLPAARGAVRGCAELAGDVQDHLDRISNRSDEAPDDRAGLVESQRLRERIIAAGAT